MISRGLIISLGITTIYSILTYYYFNNRMNTIEEKVDIIFKLVQNHTKNNLSQNNLSQNNTSNNIDDTTEHTISLNKPNLIPISDDDDYSDEESSNSSNSDEEEEEEEETLNRSNININENLNINNVNIVEVENIEKPSHLGKNNLNSLEKTSSDNDSLDELSDIDIEEGNNDEQDNNNEQDNNDEQNNNDEQDNNEQKDDNEQDNDPQEKLNESDLKKYNMKILKDIADKKGLSNYKSLKKTHLINLILEN
jgi:hypothetical protein